MSDVAESLPPRDHNQPPLVEQIAEETTEFRARTTALVDGVNNSRIDSDETAAQVTSLGTQLRDLKEKVEAYRKEKAKPFDDGKATVQRKVKAEIIDVLDTAMTQCRRMLDAYRDAETARHRAEAAAAAAAADAAHAEAEKARASGDIGAAIKAEMAEVQALDRAGGAAIRPDTMIRTQSGAAVASTQRVPVVTNIGLCLRWMIQNQSAALLETLAPLIARLVRAKIAIPGVSVEERTTTQFRR